MIDTVVLTIHKPYYTLLGNKQLRTTHMRGFTKRHYNPTNKEKQDYGYLPRYKEIEAIRTGGYTTFLQVEFSVPKLLYGNNFDEVQKSDFKSICLKLKDSLYQIGVEIRDVRWIMDADISSVHYSKNIILTDYSSPHSYIKHISKANIKNIYDVNMTNYRNDGHSIKFHSNSFEVTFYDKLADLKQAKKSDKRAIENDNYTQLSLFTPLRELKPFEVLRMEVRLGNRRTIKQILEKNSLNNIERNFCSLFKETISKTILLENLTNIENTYPVILRSDAETLEDFMTDIQLNNPDLKFKKLLEYTGAYSILQSSGVRGLRKITQRYPNYNWYRLNKEMKDLKLRKKLDVFGTIRASLEEFERVQLEKYIDKM